VQTSLSVTEKYKSFVWNDRTSYSNPLDPNDPKPDKLLSESYTTVKICGSHRPAIRLSLNPLKIKSNLNCI